MDAITLLVIAGLIIAILIVVALLIWRSRSESILRVPVAGPSAPGASPGPGVATDQSLEETPGEQEGLVPIQHPLVRRSAQQALEKGGPMTRYIVQQGDQLFFTFEALTDPIERRQAYDLMRRFNAGDQIDIRAFLNVIKQMTNNE